MSFADQVEKYRSRKVRTAGSEGCAAGVGVHADKNDEIRMMNDERMPKAE
jgi:hypothetical protein